MARIMFKDAASAAARKAALEAMERFAAAGASKKKRRATPTELLDRAAEDGDKLWKEERCDELEARHFVGIYALLHRDTYGVMPSELTMQKNYPAAVRAAQRMLERDFTGDPMAMLRFVQWVWRREKKRERRINGDGDGRRIGWPIQFTSRALLNDYRVAKNRLDRERRASR